MDIKDMNEKIKPTEIFGICLYQNILIAFGGN